MPTDETTSARLRQHCVRIRSTIILGWFSGRKATITGKAGDYFGFFAEIDFVRAISTCPRGDPSVQVWSEDSGDSIDSSRPLGVAVYQPRVELLKGWQSPPTVDYRGTHRLDRA